MMSWAEAPRLVRAAERRSKCGFFNAFFTIYTMLFSAASPGPNSPIDSDAL
jgi:hypothetical protein